MNQICFPSVRRLKLAFGCSTKTAAQCRAIMRGDIRFGAGRGTWTGDLARSLESMNLPATAAWVQSCYYPPSAHEMQMAALDEILGSFGVEFINLEPDNYRDPQGIEYLNMGGTYRETLLYQNGRFRMGCWGDALEAWEHRHGRVE